MFSGNFVKSNKVVFYVYCEVRMTEMLTSIEIEIWWRLCDMKLSVIWLVVWNMLEFSLGIYQRQFWKLNNTAELISCTWYIIRQYWTMLVNWDAQKRKCERQNWKKELLSFKVLFQTKTLSNHQTDLPFLSLT